MPHELDAAGLPHRPLPCASRPLARTRSAAYRASRRPTLPPVFGAVPSAPGLAAPPPRRRPTGPSGPVRRAVAAPVGRTPELDAPRVVASWKKVLAAGPAAQFPPGGRD